VNVFEQIIQRALDAKNKAAQAAQQAEQDRRRRREENDLWVNGGVHWNGYGLESLIKMVAERSNPGQLDALAGEWGMHGQAVVRTSENLRRSLSTLMQYWSGSAADLAVQKVSNNVAWIAELGGTAQQMARPIQDASGALRSAQDTMPGMPKNNWLASAGGGAAAGMMIGGPIGAAFGAALGGIASAFGFGNKKKKMKRKAVQTMQRYEGALLGVDQTTPQFGLPSDGVNPGDGPINRPDPGIETPGGVTPPPGTGTDPGASRPGLPLPGPVPPFDWNATDPSFAGTPEARWQSLTGIGPNAVGGGGGPGGGGLGLGALPPGVLAGGARPGGMGGPYGAGRGGASAGRGAGAGARGAAGGYPGGMGGAGAGRGDREYRGRGRFSRGGALTGGGRGGYGMGGAPTGRGEEERDGEHRRRVPLEEDPFSTDMKAAPPVIGI
jgi:hypothetical protein